MRSTTPLLARRPAWLAPSAVAVIAVTGAVALAWIDPERRAQLMPGCPFRMVTGLDCPGCGATRAMSALVRGDVVLAADHNLLLVALLPLLAWAWAGWLAASLGRRERAPTLPAGMSMTLVGAIVVFGVVRNLPFESVAWLGSAPSG